MDTSIFTRAALATVGLQGVGFTAAYLLHTEVFYDILGGLNYILLAFLGHPGRQGGGGGAAASARHSSMTCLFLASRGWLLVFLAWRAHSRKGDARFNEWINRPAVFFAVWMIQGVWVFLISWPLLVVQMLDHGSDVVRQQQQQQGTSMTFWDTLMLLGFGVGVSIEIHADVQKALWVSQGRPGGFCRVGLWNWSRHPNYFGEILQWWCAWFLSLGSVVEAARMASNSNDNQLVIVFGFLGILSPLFTMNILLNMSGTGIWAAEGKNLKRYYESEHAQAYKEYRASTSPLIPMWGYKDIPLWVKRRFLFEWKRYEYQPTSSNKSNSQKKD